jgi:hypothetical protein
VMLKLIGIACANDNMIILDCGQSALFPFS